MENINYDKLTAGFLKDSPSVLLHCCCGVCASSVAERLITLCRPTLYFYNPNIDTSDEYYKRLKSLEKVAEYFSLPLIFEDYRTQSFTDAVRGYELLPEGGARCAVCFELRLKKTAEKAVELGFPLFCSTLTVSPHKNSRIINEVGKKAEGVAKWLPSDFKKHDGYKRSSDLSAALGLYRQDYCGCEFAKIIQYGRQAKDNNIINDIKI